LVAVIW